MKKREINEKCGNLGNTYTEYCLTEDEYQEYQDLKTRSKNDKRFSVSLEELQEFYELRKFKADCDKDIEEWDKGIEICRWCGHEYERGYFKCCSSGNGYCDQETLEDRVSDLENEYDSLERDFVYEAELMDDRLSDAECEIRQINKDFGNFNNTVIDRLDDLECDVRRIRKDLDAQILINKVK